MSALIDSNHSRIIVGLGKTGMSCVHYLTKKKLSFKVMDTRNNPLSGEEFKREYPQVPVYLGGFYRNWLIQADELIISPGISLSTPEITEAIIAGAEVLGDIELFCRETKQPIVAITGSNGKSTVTALLSAMARETGLQTAVGGNIGTPVLELLDKSNVDLFILELSSFQLETTHSLHAAAATILNISSDHMNRYPSIQDYHRAKQKIYRGCKIAVYNKTDSLTVPLLLQDTPFITFTAGKPDLHDFGLIQDTEGEWLCKGVKRLLNANLMKVFGKHNQLNALAALALGEAIGLPLKSMLQVLMTFKGLAYCCQWILKKDGVIWINDSKATNVGAAVAAIKGFGQSITGKIILIAGGDGKNANFYTLRQPLKNYGRVVLLIGRNAPDIEKAVKDVIPVKFASDLSFAIDMAKNVSKFGDLVLFSPACASFDMFADFEQRGELFNAMLKERLL